MISICSAMILSPPVFAGETTMTSGVVLEKLSPPQLVAFVAGIVEGLAHARVDGEKAPPDGRSCIYAWFYDDETAMVRIEATFAHFKDHMPGAVIAAMVEKRCPS